MYVSYYGKLFRLLRKIVRIKGVVTLMGLLTSKVLHIRRKGTRGEFACTQWMLHMAHFMYVETNGSNPLIFAHWHTKWSSWRRENYLDGICHRLDRAGGLYIIIMVVRFRGHGRSRNRHSFSIQSNCHRSNVVWNNNMIKQTLRSFFLR